MFGQQGCQVRLEWGGEGVSALGGECAVLVVVDVLSFTTAVDIAVSRGASVRPVVWDERGSVVGSRWALRPSSLLEVPPGEEVVLASPNGATLCALAGATGAVVLAGCLRNAGAVAAAAVELAGGGPIGVVPAGERWGVDLTSGTPASAGPLRPCAEDLLGAGAVVAGLVGALAGEDDLPQDGLLSVEARLAATAWAGADVAVALRGCGSGRELIAAGRAADVELAALVGASTSAPRLVDGVLRAHSPGRVPDQRPESA
ncbi:2-phosphosulfolactate phosphatase [Actinosynnema pretiosum subsp. pretiosum]|uniref:Probable 2-phosphosulfolactate phosphatase n=1 Tax=Actinosynnema pretiosum subsp. pretiosum TaxID=103721 RepID=A0AA45LCF0_9PSEU|nr:2-phosphosulfolactate phosphatase [Actinosynnema pretiosum subsp. pretiosum]